MRWLAIQIMLIVAGAPVVWAGSYYIDSRGNRVELSLATDRLAVKLTPSATKNLSSRIELSISGHEVGLPDGQTELGLSSDFFGRQQQVADSLVEAGLAEYSGAVFRVPGSHKTFSLGRQVIIQLDKPVNLDVKIEAIGLEVVRKLGPQKKMLVCMAADA